MTAPIDGVAGAVWRTVTMPARLAAPVALLARRAVAGEFWVESIQEKPGSGPEVKTSDIPQVQDPDDGAGPLNHRTYEVQIEDSSLTKEALLAAFRRDPNAFCPSSYAVFVPDPKPEGLTEGASFEVKLPGPWNGPVLVKTNAPCAIRLETLTDHMEAGWIEFSTREDDGVLTFSIESFARSGDPIFDALYHQVGVAKHLQTLMWVQTPESAVEASGGRQRGRVRVRTTIYLGETP